MVVPYMANNRYGHISRAPLEEVRELVRDEVLGRRQQFSRLQSHLRSQVISYILIRVEGLFCDHRSSGVKGTINIGTAGYSYSPRHEPEPLHVL
jgi:hypothetical protein